MYQATQGDITEMLKVSSSVIPHDSASSHLYFSFTKAFFTLLSIFSRVATALISLVVLFSVICLRLTNQRPLSGLCLNASGSRLSHQAI